MCTSKRMRVLHEDCRCFDEFRPMRRIPMQCNANKNYATMSRYESVADGGMKVMVATYACICACVLIMIRFEPMPWMLCRPRQPDLRRYIHRNDFTSCCPAK